MLHLPTDRLAELADMPPTPAEAAHLAECEACHRERAAHAAVRLLAADERVRLAPPLTSWDAIAGRLREEGLIEAVPRRGLWAGHAARWGARAAAALLLVGGGALAGRYSAGGALPVAIDGSAARVAAGMTTDGPDGAGAVVARPAANAAPGFRSASEALVALAAAERQYQLAAAYLVEQDSTVAPAEDSTEVYRTRLVALDGVMAATREALYEAPHDPVINRYYFATMGAREATLRQLNTALPVGVQINRF